MQPPLTDCARQTLEAAQTEARELNQEFVGTEHLLLALFGGNSTATRVLRGQHLDATALRQTLRAVMSRGSSAPVVSGNLPLSPKAQRAINSAIVMSQSLRESRVSTRVLLLALLDEPGTPLHGALRAVGGDEETLRKALAQKPVEEEL